MHQFCDALENESDQQQNAFVALKIRKRISLIEFFNCYEQLKSTLKQKKPAITLETWKAENLDEVQSHTFEDRRRGGVKMSAALKKVRLMMINLQPLLML
jgi:hypothetical protein